ncbi:hypothetical protein [Saccharopolyspora spinosa]|nr:hypothetical protein [Saccharopolyspora spinosa]
MSGLGETMPCCHTGAVLFGGSTGGELGALCGGTDGVGPAQAE